jgi:hypothetical protein
VFVGGDGDGSRRGISVLLGVRTIGRELEAFLAPQLSWVLWPPDGPP